MRQVVGPQFSGEVRPMTRLVKWVGDIAYWLGLIGLVVSVLLRIVPALGERLAVAPRGGMILAACLFLCALASREMAKAG